MTHSYIVLCIFSVKVIAPIENIVHYGIQCVFWNPQKNLVRKSFFLFNTKKVRKLVLRPQESCYSFQSSFCLILNFKYKIFLIHSYYIAIYYTILLFNVSSSIVLKEIQFRKKKKHEFLLILEDYQCGYICYVFVQIHRKYNTKSEQ